MSEQPNLWDELPASLKRLRSPIGVHRRGRKVLIFGGPGDGKSFFAASAPPPIFAMEMKEGGLQQYLVKGRDECVEIGTPDEFKEAAYWAIARQDRFGTLVMDPGNVIWEMWMDYWSAKFGGEIRGSKWRFVKPPWKKIWWDLMRAKFHVACTAHLKDVLYEEGEAAPGEEGQLTIKKQDVPRVERNLPYTFDWIFRTSTVLDKLNRPLPRHEVAAVKIRRPASIPPTELFIGKKWYFDDKAPVSPWERIVTPYTQYDSADNSVDTLGLESPEGQEEASEMETMANDASLGGIIRQMRKASTGIEYKRVWDSAIVPLIPLLDKDTQVEVKRLHEEKKKELGL